MLPASSAQLRSRLRQRPRLVCACAGRDARPTWPAPASLDFEIASRRPSLSNQQRATFPAAVRLGAPASFRFLVLFRLARLLFLCRATTTLAQWRGRGSRARRCRRPRLGVSWSRLSWWLDRMGTMYRASTTETPLRLDQLAHVSVACWLMFSSTPVARSITRRLEPP